MLQTTIRIRMGPLHPVHLVQAWPWSMTSIERATADRRYQHAWRARPGPDLGGETGTRWVLCISPDPKGTRLPSRVLAGSTWVSILLPARCLFSVLPSLALTRWWRRRRLIHMHLTNRPGVARMAMAGGGSRSRSRDRRGKRSYGECSSLSTIKRLIVQLSSSHAQVGDHGSFI